MPSEIHLSASPAYFSVRKVTDTADVERLSMRTFLESRVPSLFSEFRHAWWLPGGHLQTIYCALGDFTKVDPVAYDRQYIRLMDAGTLGLDFTSPPDVRDDSPIIVVMHGLTGGSYESYVRAILAPACSPVHKGGLGYRGCVVNFRGCAGVPITSGRLYNAGTTDDIRQALTYVAHRFPNARLLGVAYSLGANIMVRYIAEEGTRCRLAAACVMGNPWNLAKNNVALNSSIIGKYVYSKGMGNNLLRLVQSHAQSLGQFGNPLLIKALAGTLALKGPTMEDFDQAFTRLAGHNAPPFPFESAMDYYAWGSSHRVLPTVRIPLLAINSRDDPVVREVPTNVDDGGYVAIVITAGGGHLGWFESAAGGLFQLRRWMCAPLMEWLRATGEDLLVDLPRGLPVHQKDGFVREIGGREDLGCKEVEGGGRVMGWPDQGFLQGL